MQGVDHSLRALFHLDHETIDLGDEVVVRDVDRDGDGQSCGCGNQSDFDAAGDRCRLHFSGELDRLEGLDHADHRAQKAGERCDVRKRRQPHEPALEPRQLEQTGVLDRFHDPIGAFLAALESGEQDCSRRSLRLLAAPDRVVDAVLGEQLIRFA